MEETPLPIWARKSSGRRDDSLLDTMTTSIVPKKKKGPKMNSRNLPNKWGTKKQDSSLSAWKKRAYAKPALRLHPGAPPRPPERARRRSPKKGAGSPQPLTPPTSMGFSTTAPKQMVQTMEDDDESLSLDKADFALSRFDNAELELHSPEEWLRWARRSGYRCSHPPRRPSSS